MFKEQAVILNDCLSGGFESISSELVEIRSGIDTLNSTFEWGFSQVLTAIGGLKDSIDELILIARSPSKTWAYEKFRDAQDAFRRELFEESLELINQAILGFESNTGYSLEHRFHVHKGTILLGYFQMGELCHSIINLAGAKESYLTAAKYSRKDHPQDAGWATLSAGWACYCIGEMDQALELSRKAATLLPQVGEAHFQVAKIGYRLGQPDRVEENLVQAVRLDRTYALKAGTDGDFANHKSELETALDLLRQRIKAEAVQHLPKSKQESDTLAGLACEPFTSRQFIGSEISHISSELNEIDRCIVGNTLFSCSDALLKIVKCDNSLHNARVTFFKSAKRNIQSRRKAAQSAQSQAQGKESPAGAVTEKVMFTSWIVCAIPAVIFFSSTLKGCWNTNSFGNPKYNEVEAFFGLIGIVMGAGILGWILYFVVAAVGAIIGGIVGLFTHTAHVIKKHTDVSAANQDSNYWDRVEADLLALAAKHQINRSELT